MLLLITAIQSRDGKLTQEKHRKRANLAHSLDQGRVMFKLSLQILPE